MNQAKSLHPSPEQLADFGQGRLSAQDQAGIERHIAGCDTCCQALRCLPDDTLAEKLRHANSSAGMSGGAHAAEFPHELDDHPRYRIVKLLGAGGMGVVYQAIHRLMERTVALKVINRELTRNPAAVERFRREARAAGRLSHPNIVTAHDAEQAGELHFLVMEYVEGISLSKLVEAQGPLPITQASQYVLKVALGLQHAFEQGMVHRDIKPQNLMLTSKGQVKILDFGLARFALEADPGGDTIVGGGARSTRRLTSVSMVLGTPDYIAPEQISDSRQTDIRADIYSLGCTFYYLLTGHVPFPAGSVADKLSAHAQRKPTPLTLERRDVSEALERIVEKMMGKDPALRYRTPAEIAQALTPFARGSLASSSPQPAPARPVPAAIPESDLPTQPLDIPGIPRKSLLAGLRGKPLLLAGGSLAVLMPLIVFFVIYLGGMSPWAGPGNTANQTGKDVALKSTTNQQPDVIPGKAKPTGTVVMIIPREYRGPEYVALRDELETIGKMKVTVASSYLFTCKPVAYDGAGPLVEPETTLDKVRAADLDALVLGGGHIYDYSHEGPSQGKVAEALIKETLAAKKFVAAASDGQRLLVGSGVLKGRKAALDPVMLKFYAQMGLSDTGAIPVTDQVVEDRHVITANSSQHARQMAQLLLQKLGKSQ